MITKEDIKKFFVVASENHIILQAVDIECYIHSASSGYWIFFYKNPKANYKLGNMSCILFNGNKEKIYPTEHSLLKEFEWANLFIEGVYQHHNGFGGYVINSRQVSVEQAHQIIFDLEKLSRLSSFI